MGIRHGLRCFRIGRNPLVRTSRAFIQIPIVTEQNIKIANATPLDRIGRPCPFATAAVWVTAFPAAEAALPAKTLLFDTGGFGLRPHMGRRTGAMTFTKGMAAGDQCGSLLVGHGHAGESFSNIAAGGDGIRFAIRSLRIHVNQTHLHSSEGILEFPITRVALIAEPLALCPPVNILLRLPDVLTPSTEAEGLKSHRLKGAIAREDYQTSPGYLFAVFLLNRPEKPARLV